MPSATPATPRTGKELLRATLEFAHEQRARSWFTLILTVVLMLAALLFAALAPNWPLQLLGSVFTAALMVRVFVICHDYMHGAIFKDSRVAKPLFSVLSGFVLVPPQSWRDSHDFHHAHVGKLEATSRGSFPILTVELYKQASFGQRLYYRVSRSPLSIALAYITVFLLNVCLLPLLQNPKRHWDAGLTLLAHVGLIAGFWYFAGFGVMVFAYWLPLLLAGAFGSFLFYIQHNLPTVRIFEGDTWGYHRAALESSSYLQLGPVMRWATACIGYHHVHHLNPHIPFYRLPEAMAAIPELQQPIVITLKPSDMFACLRLKLWDSQRQRLVTWREAGLAAAG